jgi:hypothetical protein
MCIAYQKSAWVSFVAILMLYPALASARPTFGLVCTRCHQEQSGHQHVSGPATLTLRRLDRLNAGRLVLFTVRRGASLTIPVTVTNGADRFAVQFSNFNGGGLQRSRSNLLRYTVHGFVGLGSPIYYVSTPDCTNWARKTTVVNFTITIKSNCPVDIYELDARVCGLGRSGRWAQTQRIYVQVK